jgi:integrase
MKEASPVEAPLAYPGYLGYFRPASIAPPVAVAGNRATMRLRDNCGPRASELVELDWRSLVANFTGKGGGTRVVRLSPETWDEIAAFAFLKQSRTTVFFQ